MRDVPKWLFSQLTRVGVSSGGRNVPADSRTNYTRSLPAVLTWLQRWAGRRCAPKPPTQLLQGSAGVVLVGFWVLSSSSLFWCCCQEDGAGCRAVAAPSRAVAAPIVWQDMQDFLVLAV